MSLDSAPFPPTIPNLRDTAPSPFPTTTYIFGEAAPSPSALPSPLYPRGLPHHVVIILTSTIPTVFTLALVMGIIHCVRRRNKRKLQKQHHADIEKSLVLSRRPILAIDTDVPRANELQRSASGGRLPLTFVASSGLPQMPAAHVRVEERQQPGIFTRKSMLRPGVGGRQKTTIQPPALVHLGDRG
ncbi:hypothetical protein BDU57DRAFT_344598 [Ampelomyces quisqualis]|uniref:Uncharacterized protein n=1 Tax=Ampelomyces quisqualis TaxID=50730 RepID=A0A6A5QDZ2_AMPQU|nr:hypothetical protein BDU57DRAFT_344598 [Ampelomyces quisqualis]